MIEKDRKRAQRRHDERRVQRNRLQLLIHRWLLIEENFSEVRYGKLRHGHQACGCTMCKPWKSRQGRKLASWEAKNRLPPMITEEL